MNARIHRFSSPLSGVVVGALALGACSELPAPSPGAEAARIRLAQLQADPQLARRAPEALNAAESAVREAELPHQDDELAAHRLLMAERSIDIARALAERRLAEEQRERLVVQREEARLHARTRQADVARDDLSSARKDAEQSRHQAEVARAEASTAQQAGAAVQARIDELEGRPTDRGLVITLGDVLFGSGEAGLNEGVTPGLDRIAAFMEVYPERTATVEGHTDSVGRGDANLDLSQRRADAVKAYLVARGISATRIVASGMGEHMPIAPNDSASGRLRNRRVDIIIDTRSDGRR